ncbi:MAG: hypothetical protein JW874_11575 [Spirochaetales bacterium]|nr:hypothetical protein [Spirochaetales bacterium]
MHVTEARSESEIRSYYRIVSEMYFNRHGYTYSGNVLSGEYLNAGGNLKRIWILKKGSNVLGGFEINITDGKRNLPCEGQIGDLGRYLPAGLPKTDCAEISKLVALEDKALNAGLIEMAYAIGGIFSETGLQGLVMYSPRFFAVAYGRLLLRSPYAPIFDFNVLRHKLKSPCKKFDSFSLSLFSKKKQGPCNSTVNTPGDADRENTILMQA